MLEPNAAWPAPDELLDRSLLGPVDHSDQHCSGDEVRHVQHFLRAAGVGDLDELVLRRAGVQASEDRLDELGLEVLRWHVAVVQRRLGRQVAGEDLCRAGLVGPVKLDLDVEPAGAQDRRIDQVLAVGRSDHDDVGQSLNPVDLAEQLRHDRRLDIGGDPAAPRAEQRVHLVEEHDDGTP